MQRGPDLPRNTAWGLFLAAAIATASPAHARAPLPRVAVFDIQTDRLRLGKGTLRVLRRYLADGLAASRRFRVVPEDMLRQSLMKQVSTSRKTCFARKCQIQVGEALSADRALNTRIMKLGRRCVVSAALFGVGTQVSEGAGRATGGCGEADLQATFDRVLAQLVKGAGGSPAPVPAPDPGGGGLQVEGGDIRASVARLIVQVKPKTAWVKVKGPGGFTARGGWTWERKDLKPGAYQVTAGASAQGVCDLAGNVWEWVEGYTRGGRIKNTIRCISAMSSFNITRK